MTSQLEHSRDLLAHFHPAVRGWFASTFGEPTEPQRRGWPVIAGGDNVLIAAPTGSGKTLAAFLHAINDLVSQGDALEDRTSVLYISPLKALGNDVQKNLAGPLAAIRELDPALPEVRVLVRSGDTPPSARQAMRKRPPHILVTTPESLYILLTSVGGRDILETVRTVIVDEIHAITRDKRGAHLALSLERLEALTGPLQRVGLSATQRPLSAVARFLVGDGRPCVEIDAGHLRELDLAIEVPSSPLSAVCAHEVWSEIFDRLVELIAEHRTTLVFVNTRRQAERVSIALARRLEGRQVACHHSSLSKDRRLDAEQRLKNGELNALVATASLELGIDIGDIDLVLQVGTTRSIATFLQRVGRSGHVLGRIPRGRIFPLTRDELAEAEALLAATRAGVLDMTPAAPNALDVLGQQLVAECAARDWNEQELFETFRRAWPYRELARERFDDVRELYTQGRYSLLHRDGVGGRLMSTKRSRLVAMQNGGAIPDTADYRVLEEPDGTFIGTLNEDFAIESSAGDIFQLGNTSWRILRVHSGVVRVVDARGAPPTVPFWFGEAPGRTRELSEAISATRAAWLETGEVPSAAGVDSAVTEQLTEYLGESCKVLGTVPTRERVVIERFFDESGGMQLVVHSVFGQRINRAWGLALRKKFCRSFGFELQAAANEEAFLLSLGQQHSFALDDVFEYLNPKTVRDTLVQALLPTPLFQTHWRWNASASLLVERRRNGQRVPAPLQRFRAEDLLQQTFPQVLACGETLPPGDLPVPEDHPLIHQTLDDALYQVMDLDGLIEVLEGLRDGSIERVTVDTPEPSQLAHGILNAMPYAFLDDAPLEERRTQAVLTRRGLPARALDEIGALDADAISRVRDEAWPTPTCAEEVHEALLWMGYVTTAEAEAWQPWIDELAAAARIERAADHRWFAVEATRDARDVLSGRMEALGPVCSDDPMMLQLESDGVVLRTRFDGQDGWCNRRLLARIQRYTLERLRREIEPVTARNFLRFLAAWQHLTPDRLLEGPRGVAEVAEQLAGFEVAATAWERSVLPARVKLYLPEWVDDLCLTGRLTWGRLWGSARTPMRATPVTLLPRHDFDRWTELAGPPNREGLTGATAQIDQLIRERGALFFEDIQRGAGLLESQVELGLGELIAHGIVTCDSLSGLRRVLPRRGRRRFTPRAGRWSPFRYQRDKNTSPDDTVADTVDEATIELVAQQALRRWGVLFRKLYQREKFPVPWRLLLRYLRTLEVRGEVRGGRFVAGFEGEQFALPEAIPMLRKIRRNEDQWHAITVAAADPLNLTGILTPEERVPPTTHATITIR